ncbi:MAG TPA: 2Fe-2S iron-sulfur cluster-binding protein, partial [Pseudomonadales bacterium]
MNKLQVSTQINGERMEFLCEPQQSMLDVLRDNLHLTGTKEGCATGDCGACSILLDGQLVCSCLMLAAESSGRKLTTIEGIGRG